GGGPGGGGGGRGGPRRGGPARGGPAWVGVGAAPARPSPSSWRRHPPPATTASGAHRVSGDSGNPAATGLTVIDNPDATSAACTTRRRMTFIPNLPFVLMPNSPFVAFRIFLSFPAELARAAKADEPSPLAIRWSVSDRE